MIVPDMLDGPLQLSQTELKACSNLVVFCARADGSISRYTVIAEPWSTISAPNQSRAVRLAIRVACDRATPDLVTEWRVEDDFVAAVKSKGRIRPHPNFEDGVRYMRVVQAVADSRARNEWVPIKHARFGLRVPAVARARRRISLRINPRKIARLRPSCAANASEGPVDHGGAGLTGIVRFSRRRQPPKA